MDGHSTDTLTFTYAYDEQGLVEQRDVVTDQGTTRTTYAHDALGRLTRSVASGAVTGRDITVYAWDAASNLVAEGGTDDPSTSKAGDAYAVARAVNAANELVAVVKDPVGTRGGKVETTQFTYDGRGNRTGSVTTTGTGRKTHVESRSTFSYDGMDQLTSTSGPEGSAVWVRDGVGRALTVREGGVTSARLYDGITVVAEGNTQLSTAPNGQVLSETTTTRTLTGWGWCKKITTSVATVDVLTDVLGSAVGTASGGVISSDLALYGDFGEALTTPKQDTVTGFTGKVSTAGLVEFASRTYDPSTRQWVQDDRYRGTTTRAASMNRYAYVEGAPETFVDQLGFYRAAAALQAQRLAALQTALESEFAEFQQVYSNQVLYGQGLTVKQMMASYNALHASDDPVIREVMDKIAREAFYDVTQVHAQERLQARYEELQAQVVRQNKLIVIARQYQSEQLQIQAERDSLLFYQTTVQTVTVLKDPSFATHSVLDVVGMVPVIGEVADLVNAGIYAAEGNYLDASLSLAGMVPFAGAAVTGARMIKTSIKAADRAMDMADVASDAFRMADNLPLSAATPPIATLGKLPEVPTMRMPDLPSVKAPDVPTMIEAPPVLKQIEAPPVLKQIEAPPVLKQIEAAPAANSGLATTRNGAVFWSGIKGGDEVAAAWAAENGGATLATTAAQRGIELPVWDASDPAAVSAWRQASAEFAQGAAGDVTVLQADTVRINSFWAEVEYPALTANPNVTSITAVNPSTGSTTILWARP